MNKSQQIGVTVLIQKIPSISARAGVYRMLNKNGSVLYVGKAKNLKKRLTNYTHLDKLSIRIRQMVEQVADLIVIETAGETEALLLENDLIKQFRPYYNILLKDDKSFPSILITADETPRIQKYRGNRKTKGDYFGPFASGLAVSNTLREIQKVFGLRTCSNSYFSNRTRPCLLYQIGRCAGPCCGCISIEEYLQRVKQVKAFLRGEKIPLQDELAVQMNTLATEQRYEEAALIRDKIQFLNQIQSTDAEISLGDTDIVALYSEGEKACIQLFFYRAGKAAGNTFYIVPNDEDMGDLMSLFLMQFYDNLPPPKHIYTSILVTDGTQEALSEHHQKAIKISAPPFKGMRKKLMDQALINAQTTYHSQINAAETSAATWAELQQLLRLENLDKVEIYDNSHIQGASAVGAMVAATKEGFQKKLYRRFNIDGTRAKTNDDFGMMREVLHRRLTRGLAQNDLPSAMLIDGGKGQLSSVQNIFDELGIQKIALMGVAKGEKRNAGKETLFFSNGNEVHLDEKSALQHLIQRLRDEAHRFAIGSHRQKRAKNMFHETLLDIEGIGTKRKKDLMIHFGSPREVAGASIAQLMRVTGINEKIAKKIYTFYHD